MLNYYEVLGVGRNASKDAINIACHKLIQGPMAFEISRTLLDDNERVKYDKILDGNMVIQQTPVSWDSYSWRDAKYDGIKEKVNNNQGRLALSILGIMVYIVLAFISAATLTLDDESGLSFAPYAHAVVSFIWLVNCKKKPSIIAQSFMALWTGSVITWIVAFSYLELGSKFIATFAAVMLLLWGFTMNKLSYGAVGEHSKVSLRTRIPANHILNNYQWGIAGNLQDALGKFGYENIHKGETGEKYTEKLLHTFYGIPGVRVFHGLKFPGTRNADVDHAILSGDNLIFIDSKQWSSGDYWWEGDGNISQKTKSGKLIKRETSFRVAVSRYQTLLPKKLNIYAVILVHGENVRILNNPEFLGISMANTADGIGIIGQLVNDGVKDGEINHVLMNSLASSLK